jgi:hypothetical protein
MAATWVFTTRRFSSHALQRWNLSCSVIGRGTSSAHTTQRHCQVWRCRSSGAGRQFQRAGHVQHQNSLDVVGTMLATTDPFHALEAGCTEVNQQRSHIDHARREAGVTGPF